MTLQRNSSAPSAKLEALADTLHQALQAGQVAGFDDSCHLTPP